jgi:endo-1,4-beta-xylanase
MRYTWYIFARDLFTILTQALNEDGTLRSSVFSQQIGSDFITKAFTYARAADPNAKLFYNDYNLEFSGAKQDGAVKLVTDLKSKGLIDGIGLQGHFDVGKIPSNFNATVQRFANIGIQGEQIQALSWHLY